jgi:2-dehydro-3-deoxyphosphogluconate aldolase/(4S)-4-hydroxy-2-oxoglutarate aldolase
MTSLQRQPLIVCIRLKSFLVRDYYGDWTPLGQIQKRLLFMAEENRIPLADHEARTAAMVVYIAKILVEAGLYNLEITMDMPGVEYALSYLHEILGDSVMLGAGTVLQGKQLQRAIAAGCRFAMSPVLLSGLTERLIHEANQHHVLFIPGAATPSECVQASLALGEGRPVKVFPADVVGGLRFVRAMASPLSHIPLVPTSGITFDGVQGYLEAANVYAVGASQQILPPEQLLAGDWGRIHQLASQWRRVVESYARCKAVCLKASQSNECKA